MFWRICTVWALALVTIVGSSPVVVGGQGGGSNYGAGWRAFATATVG